MKLEDLKLRKLSELTGHTLTQVVYVYDGVLLVFGTDITFIGAEEGYERGQADVTFNPHDFRLEHYTSDLKDEKVIE